MNLTLNNISFSYKTKYQTVQAVKNASCSFEQGKFYAVIGKSGSGKTTLLSLAAGLEVPDGGNIIFNGENIKNMNKDGYRRDIVSVIYQNFNLFPLLTVMENVIYPMTLKKSSKNAAYKKAAEVLKKVGLDEKYYKRLPAMLSGGEQQRVAIARALASGTKVILADEPTGNLDSENTKNIVELLAALAHEENCCIVVITHDQNVANAADCVYKMDSGVLNIE
mgnify:FL=1